MNVNEWMNEWMNECYSWMARPDWELNQSFILSSMWGTQIDIKIGGFIPVGWFGSSSCQHPYRSTVSPYTPPPPRLLRFVESLVLGGWERPACVTPCQSTGPRRGVQTPTWLDLHHWWPTTVRKPPPSRRQPSLTGTIARDDTRDLSTNTAPTSRHASNG